MIILLLLFSVCFIVFLTAKYGVHPFLALLGASFIFAIGNGTPLQDIVGLVNHGFGKTLGSIGIVIILGVVIGVFLEKTGAAYKLADLVIKCIGEKRIHEAMGIIGFIVSIPVFCDSGFVILNPLNKSLTKKAGASLAGTATALMFGLQITHVLIPPTPGPLAATALIGADVGLVMLVGLVVGLFALSIAVLYCKKVASKTFIDPNPDLTEEEINQKIADAPSAMKSVLPILVPILLIVGKSILDFNKESIDQEAQWFEVVSFIGTPVIALLIGMLISLTLPKKLERKMLSSDGWVGKAFSESSNILLITGAGGVFGTILQQSDFTELMTDTLSDSNLGIWIPFLFAAALKTAQGSSTVALTAAAAFTAPLLSSLGLDTDLQKAFAVIAIGAGSVVISHANDSGFWLVTQFARMDVKTGYRIFSVGSLVVGTSAATFTYILSLIF